MLLRLTLCVTVHRSSSAYRLVCLQKTNIENYTVLGLPNAAIGFAMVLVLRICL